MQYWLCCQSTACEPERSRTCDLGISTGREAAYTCGTQKPAQPPNCRYFGCQAMPSLTIFATVAQKPPCGKCSFAVAHRTERSDAAPACIRRSAADSRRPASTRRVRKARMPFDTPEL